MRSFIIKSIFIFAIFCAVCGVATVAKAETRIESDYYIRGNAYWPISGNPYILEGDITIMPGASLTVDPGVTIDSDPDLEYKPRIYSNGSIYLNGEEQSMITIKNIYDITIDQATATISWSKIDSDNGISFIGSKGFISSSTIENGFQGIYSKASKLHIIGSRISNNAYGMIVEPVPQIFLGSLDESRWQPSSRDIYGIGGIGNAFDDGSGTNFDMGDSSDEGNTEPSVSIINSTLLNNSQDAIENSDSFSVDARQDWWGSASGPSSVGANSVSGMVDDIPWLDHDPTTPGNPCCSSVLFLPGIEGSRLYASQNGSFDPGEAIRRLWEPISNGEVRSLYLDKNGYSSSSIYVGSPIDKALGVMDVYGKFMDFLNGLVKTGEIKEWRSFGYDWRLPASDIVLDPAMRATTTESLIAITEALASRSKTGKVTIIAHSYGGLVAKYLIKALEDIGESDIVDKVISVAVPYIGTPQALAGLLHGDDTAIAYGVILMRSVARGLAENMPSVYLLLPSSRYFTEVKAPVISFETKKVSLVNNGSYSQNIDSSAGQRGFIADIFDERSKAGIFDTSLPLIGNDLLLSEADAFHDDIDGYGWPSSIEDWALVGWNKPTTSGIYYYDTASCSVPMFGIPCPGHKDLKTDMGDGTVIAKSAAFGNDAGRIISLDLKAIDKAERGYFNHMNILESSTTQAAIRKIVIGSSTSGTGAGSSASGSGGSVSSGSSLASERNMLQGISNEDPISTEKTDSLSVIVSAPAEIHVYDKYGNHTGPIMPFVGIGAESGLYSVYETKIPGSAFTSERYDSGYGDTQIELPYEYNAYTIVIKAVGSGILSLAIVHSKDGGIVDQVAFPSIPITSLTSATTTVIISSASGAAALCSPVKRSLASSTSPLLIDFDGLGFTEASVYP